MVSLLLPADIRRCIDFYFVWDALGTILDMIRVWGFGAAIIAIVFAEAVIDYVFIVWCLFVVNINVIVVGCRWVARRISGCRWVACHTRLSSCVLARSTHHFIDIINVIINILT